MGKLKIIGGKFRSQNISFSDTKNLRPTLNKVKETLFNWLSQDICEKKCLDLFAGSGSLGIEALSRAAGYVAFVEKNNILAKDLKVTLNKLKILNDLYIVHNIDGINYLQNNNESFDLIFLDPPYDSDILSNCLNIIMKKKELYVNSIIYIEYEKQINLDNYYSLKSSRVGVVHFNLLKVKN